METQQQNFQNFTPPAKKKAGCFKIGFMFIGGLILLSFIVSLFSNKKPNDATPTQQAVTTETTQQPIAETTVSPEEEEVTAKLKAKAAGDWPDDYSTQEFWVNKEIEDYRFMLTIPANSLKRKAQQDWPLDFSTQKFWYNQQIEAKERMGK
jgi:hypothetical protein